MKATIRRMAAAAAIRHSRRNGVQIKADGAVVDTAGELLVFTVVMVCLAFRIGLFPYGFASPCSRDGQSEEVRQNIVQLHNYYYSK